MAIKQVIQPIERVESKSIKFSTTGNIISEFLKKSSINATIKDICIMVSKDAITTKTMTSDNSTFTNTKLESSVIITKPKEDFVAAIRDVNVFLQLLSSMKDQIDFTYTDNFLVLKNNNVIVEYRLLEDLQPFEKTPKIETPNIIHLQNSEVVDFIKISRSVKADSITFGCHENVLKMVCVGDNHSVQKTLKVKSNDFKHIYSTDKLSDILSLFDGETMVEFQFGNELSPMLIKVKDTAQEYVYILAPKEE